MEEVKKTPTLESVNDFSDKLSPMLVKELRQGLRGRGFVILFVTLQVLLVMMMIGFSSADTYGNSGQALSSTLMMFFGMAVLFVQPLRGVTALSSEIKGKTIDLMVLTRLSAWRIVFGKWVSLVSQSALILAAILPYMIMRYFFGGMQLFGELAILVCIFVTSMTLTALTIGVSAIPSLVLRGILCLIGGFFVLQLTITGIFVSMSGLVGVFSFSDPDSKYILISFFVICGYLGWLSLDFAATRIAPLAENRSTVRKFVGTLVVLAVFASLVAYSEEAALVMSLLFMVPLILMSLTENAYLVPRVCKPFVKRGSLGKVAGRILYPGWLSGVAYTMLLFVLLHVLNAFTGFEMYSDTEMHAVMISAFGILLFPLVVVRLFFKNAKYPIGVYLAVMLFSWLVGLMALIVSEISDQDIIMNLLGFIPPVNMMAAMDSHNEDVAVVFAYVAVFGYSLLLLTLGRGVSKQVGEAERIAEGLNEKEN